MRCRVKIEEYLESLGDEDIIFVSRLYSEKFSEYSETAFFKTMERMVKEGTLVRISKGIYAKNKSENCNDAFHMNAIMNYYFGENNDNGMYIGYKLYNKYGISEIETDVIELYSNIVDQDKKNIGNLEIRKVLVELNYDNAKVIEAFEILQNFDTIKHLNRKKFAEYAKQFAKGYDEESAVRVLAAIKYKKSTIAFMKSILDMYHVNNSLGSYLNCTSKYKIPKIAKVG